MMCQRKFDDISIISTSKKHENINIQKNVNIDMMSAEKVRTDGDMIKVSSTGNNVKILVLKAQRKMTGKYIIKAKNEHGEDTAEMEFTVLGGSLLYDLASLLHYYCALIALFGLIYL